MAHSGTVIGLLLDPGHADGPATTDYLASHLPGLESISLHRMVGGGPRLTLEGEPFENAKEPSWSQGGFAFSPPLNCCNSSKTHPGFDSRLE